MTESLAINGGQPVRPTSLPYGRQYIDEHDIAAVSAALKSDLITTGPTAERFEQAFCELTETAHAVAFSSGTAALHGAMFAAGITSSDEVVVPCMTFVATANAVVFQGGQPIFCDVAPSTLLIDPTQLSSLISSRTKAIVCVDYAGQPCDYAALREIADHNNLMLIADACHSLGARFKQRMVGGLADLSAFSFHPVKPITTAEGGMVTTNDALLADRLRRFRNHCISTEYKDRGSSWLYDVTDLGYNYRLSDIQCALGLNQLDRLPMWIDKRNSIAVRYDDEIGQIPGITPLARCPDRSHAYHLYVVQCDANMIGTSRQQLFAALRAEGIGVNVHYVPAHLHSYYRDQHDTAAGQCPQAESAYERILSLPIFPAMQDNDVDDVVRAMHKVTAHYASHSS